ncbi:hypothetical protein, partial [Acinetobacter baumannii]|uniref:hypothetical protein n=1 Tax=Acinetobacter baumannii TaxID=470 RepID=UPI001C0951A4
GNVQAIGGGTEITQLRQPDRGFEKTNVHVAREPLDRRREAARQGGSATLMRARMPYRASQSI